MKVLHLAFFFFLTGFTSYTQDKSGYIRFATAVIPIDSSASNIQAASMFRNSKIELYFSETAYKVEINSGNFGKTINIADYTKDSLLFLASNNKLNIAKKTVIGNPIKSEVTAFDIYVNRDSIRTILGFKCYHVTLIENGETSYYWCTDDLDISLQGQPIFSEKLPGFPLEINQSKMGFQFTYTASNYVDFISNPSKVFSLEIPEGYIEVNN